MVYIQIYTIIHEYFGYIQPYQLCIRTLAGIRTLILLVVPNSSTKLKEALKNLKCPNT